MKTIIFKEFRRTRRSLWIWGAVIALVALMGMLEYPALAPIIGSVEGALLMIPRIGQLVFGVYNVDLNEPIGYYVVMYYWTGLIVFVHAIYTGASMISKESRDRTAEYLFTKPYKRGTIVGAKVIAASLNVLVIALATIAASVIGMLPVTSDPAVFQRIALSGVGLLGTQLSLMSLGFLCGALFRTYKAGIRASILVLLLSYCLLFVVQSLDRPSLGFLSPLGYFQVSEVVKTGMDWRFALLATGVIALCLTATLKIYAGKQLLD